MHLYKYLLVLLILFSCAQAPVSNKLRQPASSPVACDILLKNILEQEKNISISENQFLKYYNNLNRTLSGNLATVFRSEWKAKEDAAGAASYLDELIDYFSPEVKAQLKKKPTDGEDFFQDVVSAIKDRPDRSVGMRDPPPPKGSFDRTFTYYTKSIGDKSGGKHQVRLRRYLRTIDLDKIEKDTPVRGILDGQVHEIQKIGKDKYKLKVGKKIDLTNNQMLETSEDLVLTKQELESRYGSPAILYSYPHAKKYKLEVKSRPHDSIGLDGHEKLQGQNYVQKLSVNLSDEQAQMLFGTANRSENLLDQIRQLEESVLTDPKNEKERTQAVFDVLRLGAEKDSNFLKTRGSTEYKRYAFEVLLPDKIDGKPVKIQTTFDTNMGTRNNYDTNGDFLSPIESIRLNSLLSPKSAEEVFHIELKIPKALIERVEQGGGSEQLKEILRIFNSYRVTNKGKFNHIQYQRDIDK